MQKYTFLKQKEDGTLLDFGVVACGVDEAHAAQIIELEMGIDLSEFALFSVE